MTHPDSALVFATVLVCLPLTLKIQIPGRAHHLKLTNIAPENLLRGEGEVVT